MKRESKMISVSYVAENITESNKEAHLIGSHGNVEVTVIILCNGTQIKQITYDTLLAARRALGERGYNIAYPNCDTLGERIAEIRLSADMSQTDTAEKLGCMQKDISRWENNVVEPKLSNIIKMSEVFGCWMEDFKII